MYLFTMKSNSTLKQNIGSLHACREAKGWNLNQMTKIQIVCNEVRGM
jgi:hypothetical protein